VQATLGVGQPPLQFGHPLLHRPLHVVHLCLRRAAGVLDFGLRAASGILERAAEIGDLHVGGSPQLVGMFLGGIANEGELLLGALPDVRCGGLGRLGHGALALVRRGPSQVLGKRAEVGLEMPAHADDHAVQRLTDLVVHLGQL
jgi:hypothetical protein